MSEKLLLNGTWTNEECTDLINRDRKCSRIGGWSQDFAFLFFASCCMSMSWDNKCFLVSGMLPRRRIESVINDASTVAESVSALENGKRADSAFGCPCG